MPVFLETGYQESSFQEFYMNSCISEESYEEKSGTIVALVHLPLDMHSELRNKRWKLNIAVLKIPTCGIKEVFFFLVTAAIPLKRKSTSKVVQVQVNPFIALLTSV